MLYDPKWQAPETKVDPKSLPAFIEWLGKMNPRGKYDYGDCAGTCLIDRWLVHNGIEVGASEEGARNYLDFCGATEWDADIACMRPWTFGAALERARALL